MPWGRREDGPEAVPMQYEKLIGELSQVWEFNVETQERLPVFSGIDREFLRDLGVQI